MVVQDVDEQHFVRTIVTRRRQQPGAHSLGGSGDDPPPGAHRGQLRPVGEPGHRGVGIGNGDGAPHQQMREHHARRGSKALGLGIGIGNDRPDRDGDVRAVTRLSRRKAGAVIGGNGALPGIDEIGKTIGQAKIAGEGRRVRR